MERFDVAVVGAGLAGLVCARLLSRRGLRVLLIDRKRAPDAVVQTTGIFVRKTLEDFDLPADCLGPPVRRVVLYSPAGRAMPLESPHEEFRVGRMGRMYRSLLRDGLRAGLTFAGSTRYLGAAADRGGEQPGSIVHLLRDGRPWTVGVRFLVGADGVLSCVAADLGLDRNREWIVGIEKVYDLPRRSGPRTLHCFLDPRLAPGYLAWVCDDGSEAHIGLAGLPGRFDPAAALAEFRTRAAGVIDLRNASLRERRGGRIPVGGVLGNIVCLRGLLIGDAAGAASPLTAGGLDPCLRLSTLAAEVIGEYLGSGTGANSAALRRYDGRAFRARFTSRLWMRRLFESITSPWMLEAACLALRLPSLRRLAEHVFFGRGSFPEAGPAAAAVTAK